MQRGGQLVALFVPITRASLGDEFRAYIRLFGPVAVLQFIASAFFFSLGAIVYAAKEQVAPTLTYRSQPGLSLPGYPRHHRG